MSISILEKERALSELDGRPQHDPKVGGTGLSRRFVGLLMAVAVSALTINVMTLTTYPGIHPDEAAYANLAQNWLTTGNRWNTLDIGPFPGGQGLGTTLLGAIPTRLAIEVWGLDLQAIRLPSLLAGLALLGGVVGIGRLLWSGRSGFLAALVLLTQPLFLLGSHMARPEIWVGLVTLLALGCSLLGWKRKQPLWDVIAGLLAVLTVDIHQNGMVFAAGLAASYPARYGRRVLRQPNSLAFFGTSLLGALFYLYRYPGLLFPSRVTDSWNPQGAHTAHALPLMSSHPPEWIVNELVRYLLYFGKYPLSFLLIGLGITVALRQRHSADRLLLAWLVGSAVAMMLLVSHKLETYLIPTISVGGLLTGHAMDKLLHHEGPLGRPVVALSFTALTLPLLLTLGKSDAHQMVQLQHQLQQSIPCQRILGPNPYWLAFSDCDYRSWDVVNHFHHLQGTSFEESLAAIRPDYLLIDETILTKLWEDFGEGGSTASYYALPRADFYQFLDKRTTLVHWFMGPGQNIIQIYKVNWETMP